MSPHLTDAFARTRGGRALLHGLCLARGRNVRWHLGGIVRELFGRGGARSGTDFESVDAGSDGARSRTCSGRETPGRLQPAVALLAAVLAGAASVGPAWGAAAAFVAPSPDSNPGLSSPAPAGSIPPAPPATSPGPGPGQIMAETRVVLLPVAAVDSTGIFLHQVAAVTGLDPAVARIRVANAPAFGRMVTLGRAQVIAAVQAARPELGAAAWTWSGNESVRVTRRSRMLAEGDLRDLLASTLQAEVVKDRGELELRLARPWVAVPVPDEPLTLKILDLPSAGVSQHFILRFELAAGDDRVGPWQAVAQARVMRNILVAGPGIRRGQTLDAAELSVERRDILPLREPLDESARRAGPMEFTEAVMSGQPVLARSVRARPVVQRGMMVDGLMRDGGLHISMKVEVLADGLPGQLVRVRNPKTKREFYAKVQDEQTVVINL